MEPRQERLEEGTVKNKWKKYETELEDIVAFIHVLLEALHVDRNSSSIISSLVEVVTTSFENLRKQIILITLTLDAHFVS